MLYRASYFGKKYCVTLIFQNVGDPQSNMLDIRLGVNQINKEIHIHNLFCFLAGRRGKLRVSNGCGKWHLTGPICALATSFFKQPTLKSTCIHVAITAMPQWPDSHLPTQGLPEMQY